MQEEKAMIDPANVGAGLYGLMVIFALVIGVLWTFLPFAVFGTKPRLNESIEIQRRILEELRLLRETLERTPASEVNHDQG